MNSHSQAARRWLPRLMAACLAAGTLLNSRAADSISDAPLPLEQAIQMALAKNYSIRIESLGIPIARAGVTEALGRFDPVLSGSYNDARNKEPALASVATGLRAIPTITDTDYYSLGIVGCSPWGLSYKIGASASNERGNYNNFSDTYTTFSGITLTQPILRDFGFGASLATVRIARTNRAISEWDYRDTVINTVTQVIYAYCDVQNAQSRLRSAQKSLELALTLQKENERRFQVGERSEYEILSAKAKVANREETVLIMERYVRTAENALKQLVSDQRDAAVATQRINIVSTKIDQNLHIDAAADFRTALNQRPDYQKARLSVLKSNLDRNYKRNQLLPRVDLVGSYGYNGLASDYPSARSDLRNRDYPAYSAGLSVSVPLSSSTERGRYRASKLRQVQAELALEQMEQDIVLQVANAATQLETTLKRVAVTKRARELNEQTLEADIKRLRAGTGSTFNVLYQQEQLNYAETSEAQAIADHNKARAEYDRQLGRTLEVHHIALEGGQKS